MTGLDEFYNDLFQEIVAWADADGVFKEDSFFEIVSDYLIEAGEFPEAERAYFYPDKSGIRVDGYCGDPLENKDAAGLNEGALGLIIIDLNQSQDIVTLTNADMNKAFKRLTKYIEKSMDDKFRNSLEETDPGFGLADLINTRWSNISRIKLFLLTNKVISSRIDGMEEGSILDKPVTYSVWDLSRLHRLIESGQEREPLEINFSELPSGPIRALLASSPNAKEKVYLAAIPGTDLAQIYDKWGTRLLEQNVRVFLQARSNVNKGIKNTLEHDPEHFFSFNNGITATAEGVTTESSDDGLVITHLDNLQIVNGGQTTASIYAASRSKHDLAKVFVQMKLSVINPEEAKELVPKISEYANSQNKVSAADFFANHPYHQRMEDFSRRIYAPAKAGSFHETKWFYERARGQYRDAQAYLTAAQKKKFVAEYPKEQVFSKTDLAKYLMVWGDKPYFVNRGAQKNFAEFAKIIAKEWEEHETRFNEYYFRCLVAKKIIFRAAEKTVSESEWYEAGGYRSQHVVLALAILANGATKRDKVVDFARIWNEQSISDAFKEALQSAADVAHEILMNPGEGYRNISEWAKQSKCWQNAIAVDIDWPVEWVNELISPEEEKENQIEGNKEQVQLNGIEAQEQVIEMGAQFWKKVLAWCLESGEGSDKEIGILNAAANMTSTKIPSDKQSVILIRLMQRLRAINCPYKLRRRRRY